MFSSWPYFGPDETSSPQVNDGESRESEYRNIEACGVTENSYKAYTSLDKGTFEEEGGLVYIEKKYSETCT